MRTVMIGNKLVGPGQPCYVIAEIGINHNGDVDLAKRLIVLVEKTFLSQLAHEPECTHDRDLGRRGESRSIAVSSSWCAQKVLGDEGCEQDLQHPLAEIGEQVRRVWWRQCSPAGTRRSCVEFFETRPDEVPEAFAVDNADGDIGREPGEKTD